MGSLWRGLPMKVILRFLTFLAVSGLPLMTAAEESSTELTIDIPGMIIDRFSLLKDTLQ